MKNIKYILALAIVSLSLSSCLKDEKIENQEYGLINLDANKIVEFNSAVKAFALPYENKDTTLLIPINLAAKDLAGEDIKVELSMATSAAMVNKYNTDNDAHLEVLPTSFYSLLGSGLSLTIPSGSKTAAVQLKTNPIQFNPSTTYAIGITINSIDKNGYKISGNYKSLIVTFGAKNKYDGVYELKVKMTGNDRPTVNTTTEWSWGGPVHLVTTSGNSVNLFDDWGFGQNIQPMQTATGGYSGFGSTDPKFVLDLATNKVTAVINSVSNPANGRAFELDTTLDSQYDPATKVLVVNFIMTQPGFAPLKIRDTFTYVGKRP